MRVGCLLQEYFSWPVRISNNNYLIWRLILGNCVVNWKYCPGQFNLGWIMMFSFKNQHFVAFSDYSPLACQALLFPTCRIWWSTSEAPVQHFIWKEANTPFGYTASREDRWLLLIFKLSCWVNLQSPRVFLQGIVWKRLGGQNHCDSRALSSLAAYSVALCSCPPYLSTGRGYRPGLEGWGSLFQPVSLFSLSSSFSFVNMHLTATLCNPDLGNPGDKNA